MKTTGRVACLFLLMSAICLPGSAAPAVQAAGRADAAAVAVTWQSGTHLPQALVALGAVASSGRLITLGGQDAPGAAGTPLNKVYKSEISGGPPGQWPNGGSLDQATSYHGAALVNGRVYILGGRSAAGVLPDVRFALLDGLGNLGNWRRTADLPKKSSLAGTAVSGNVIYVAGGYDGSSAQREVYYAASGTGGVLTTWWTASSLLPSPLRGLSLTAANGYLYAIGGHDGSNASAKVYRAKINADSSLGAWQEIGALPEARERHTAVIYGGRIVVIGGLNASGGSTNSVYAATLNADGSLGGWVTGFLPSLPQARDRHAASVANIPGCGEVLYVIGGGNGDVGQDTVYYTTCPNSRPRKTYVPLVVKQQYVPPEIYGRVTQMGAGVAGVEVDLHFYNGAQWGNSNLQEVITDANGNYSFPGVAPLAAGQMYNVAYPNSEENTTRLTYEQSFAITAYGGGKISGGDLEVQNVRHNSPAQGATVSFPATFCWYTRGVAGDAYYLVLEDQGGVLHWFAAGSNPCLTLNGLPAGFQYGQTYHWSMGVENDPADNYEWGRSYYHRDVTFQDNSGQSGIYGTVTYNGAAAAGIALKLRFYNGTAWSDAATTTTGTDGRYSFTGAPALGTGQAYFVFFGPNGSNSNYVSGWFGPTITSYTAGAAVPGGNFDIADVPLLSPPGGSTLPLPVTFTWQRRGLPGDTYRLILFDLQSSNGWGTADLGDVGSVPVTGLASGMVYGKEYGWYVRVYHGSDSYGESYYYRRITFSSSMAAAPAGLPPPTLPAGVAPGILHPIPSAVSGLRLDALSGEMGRDLITQDKPAGLPPAQERGYSSGAKRWGATPSGTPQSAEENATRLDNGE